MTALNKQALREELEICSNDRMRRLALALLNELKSAENNLIDSECHVAELEESLRDKQALLEAAEKLNSELSQRNTVLTAKIEPMDRRIAELEARKVCVPRISNDEFWLSFNNRIVFREETYRSAVIKSIEDAGIGVKGE